jgi:hypothetical protein
MEKYILPLFAATKGGSETFCHFHPMLQIPVFITER